MKHLRLLKAWDGFEVGTILKVDEKTFSELVADGTGELYDEAAEKAAAAKAEADEKKLIAVVKQAVADAIPDTKGKAPAAQVHEKFEDDPKLGFKSMGEFAGAVKNWATGKRDERLIKATGLSEGVDSDGGFTVPEEFRNTLMQKTWDYAALASRAMQLPMSTDSVRIPYLVETARTDGYRQGGVLGYWRAEAGTAAGSKPTFGQLRLELNKVMALVYATDELIEDNAIGVDALINTLAANELAFQLDNKIMNGTGAGVPLGILNAACLVSQAKETGQTAATVVFENVLKMWSRMPARNRNNAAWFINQDVEPQLATMGLVIGTSGIPVYMPASGASGQPYATLFGRPVIPTEYNATCGTVGDIVLADMSQYVLGQKSGGIKAATSIHVQFLTEETAFRFSLRADGQPWWASAVTPAKGSNTLSPFVALATRA